MTAEEIILVVLFFLMVYGLLGFIAWHDYKRAKAARLKEEKETALYERLIELLEREG